MAEIKIFCPGCGQHILCDESHRGAQINCPTCNQSFVVPAAQNQAAAPPPPESAALAPGPVLWNPEAAAYWGWVFSPAFGAFLHAKNAKTLGREKEAKANWIWFYGCLAYFGFCMVSGFIFPTIPDTAFGTAWLIIYICWYAFTGRKQIKYVKNTWQDNYQRKSWVGPLSIALPIFFILFFAGILAGIEAKQTSLNQQEQAVQRNLESEVKANIQEFLHKNPDTAGTQIVSFNLVHNSGDKYKGTLIVQMDGKTETMEIDVTSDAKGFVWKRISSASPKPADTQSAPTQ